MKLRKIMPCLDIKDGKVVKGVNFVNLKEMGDPVELAVKYEQQGADELAFLDVAKSMEDRPFYTELIQAITSQISIPLTVGGGIKSLEDIELILGAGASRVSIASAALSDPELIRSAIQKFGADKVVLALDIAESEADGKYYVYTHGGSKQSSFEVFETIKLFADMGVEIFLVTGIGFDGAKQGFDVEFFKQAEQVCDKTFIASGGAGSIEHFVDLFCETGVEYGLGASVFHQGIIDIGELKECLSENGISVVPVKA